MKMISKNCKYSSYAKSNSIWSHTIYILGNEAKKLLNENKVRSITGYNGVIVIETGKGPNFFISKNYVCKYSPEMLCELWGVQDEMNEIFNDYLEYECKTKDEALLYFMAKTLGEKG